MRVAVYGAGGVGAFYGARLAAGGADVTLIARGSHLAAIRDRGLTIIEPERSSHHVLRATDDPGEVGQVDVVLFCVKSYDTESGAAQLPPLLDADTAVVSLQNGIENEETIAAAIGWEHVVGGAAYLFAGIREPGVVTASGPRGIVFGEWMGTGRTSRAEALRAACERGGIGAVIAGDIRVAKWEKLTLLAALSAMSAMVRLGLGEIVASDAARAMLRALMIEIHAVGRAAGVDLDDDLVERQFSLVVAQAPDSAASLYRDLVHGHRMELQALQGAVVRLGRRHGIATPWMDAAYAVLEPWALRNERPIHDRPRMPG